MNVILMILWVFVLAVFCCAVIVNEPNLFLGLMAFGFICLPLVLPIFRKGGR